MPTDFRSGTVFPRPGRDRNGEFLWLKRVFDKARAARNGTIFDYIYPCPMDRGVFDRWGITAKAFDAALDSCETDEAILAWLTARVPEARQRQANAWLLDEKVANLEKQDREEGVLAA